MERDNVTSLEDEIAIAVKNIKKKPQPQRPATSVLSSLNWRHKVGFIVAGVAVISIAFSIYLLSGTKRRVAEQPPIVSTNDVVDLKEDRTIFPDPQAVSNDLTTHAYEEPLPDDLYEAPPVATGISEISKITEMTKTGDTRIVIPEEEIPLDALIKLAPPKIASPEIINPASVVSALISNNAETEAIAEELPTEPDVQTASLNNAKSDLSPIKEKWQQFILPFNIPPTAPMITIIIDDMGIDQRRSKWATTLPGPLTLSYLTYANNITSQTNNARSAGHELMLHFPMQPGNASVDPGPNALTTSIDHDEILKRLRWGLNRFDGFIGVNNHMGSRFTQNKAGMRVVLKELKDRGLLFLDSRTSGGSVAAEIAKETGITFASRNVFLDHVDDRDTVREQLRQTERLAIRNGSAIAIGHPRDATLDVLSEWLPTLAEKGIVLAPLSAIVIRTHQLADLQAQN